MTDRTHLIDRKATLMRIGRMKALIGLCILTSTLLPMPISAQSQIVIAHRGASGYLPEHTLVSYAAAHAMGADYIEPDLVMTRDGVLIALHDITLQGTTDVAEAFPDRARADGRWYAADFTLDEIRQLRARERLPNRFPQGAADFRVPTFAEVIELVQGLNQTTGRAAGIYPELKSGGWHREAGFLMEEAFLEIAARYGYVGPEALIFVQSFEDEPLRRMRAMGSTLPQILLIGGGEAAARFLSPDGLGEVASFANGVGPAKSLVENDPDLVARAHARGLKVHPYTLRNDQPGSSYATGADEMRAFFFDYGVDGFFTDHPDIAVGVRRER